MSKKTLNELIKEIAQDPQFQVACAKCGKKLFVQFLDPITGRCLGCPGIVEELLRAPTSKESGE